MELRNIFKHREPSEVKNNDEPTARMDENISLSNSLESSRNQSSGVESLIASAALINLVTGPGEEIRVPISESVANMNHAVLLGEFAMGHQLFKPVLCGTTYNEDKDCYEAVAQSTLTPPPPAGLFEGPILHMGPDLHIGPEKSDNYDTALATAAD